MKNADSRREEFHREQREWTETLRRQNVIEREEVELDRLRRLPPADIDAAWIALERKVIIINRVAGVGKN